MLPPLRPFRSKVVSDIAVTRGPALAPSASTRISAKPKPAGGVRGRRIALKGVLRVDSATLAVFGARDKLVPC